MASVLGGSISLSRLGLRAGFLTFVLHGNWKWGGEVISIPVLQAIQRAHTQHAQKKLPLVTLAVVSEDVEGEPEQHSGF